jgi:hypothetical protein
MDTTERLLGLKIHIRWYILYAPTLELIALENVDIHYHHQNVQSLAVLFCSHHTC